MDLHVVGTVTCETIKLMHDAHLHPGGLDEREHLLQPVAISRPRGLARVDELPHDPCAEVVRFAMVRFSLRRDREPFLGSTSFGLFTGGDAKVGHRVHRWGIGVGWRDSYGHGGSLRSQTIPHRH